MLDRDRFRNPSAADRQFRLHRSSVMTTSRSQRDPNAEAALIESVLDRHARAGKGVRDVTWLTDDDARSAFGTIAAWQQEVGVATRSSRSSAPRTAVARSTTREPAPRGRLLRLVPYAAAAAAAALLVVIGLRVFNAGPAVDPADGSNATAANDRNANAAHHNNGNAPTLNPDRAWAPFREIVKGNIEGGSNGATVATAPWGGRVRIERATGNVKLVSVAAEALATDPINTVADPSAAAQGAERAATSGTTVPANTCVVLGQGEVTLSLQTAGGRRLTFTQHHGTLTVDDRGLIVAGGLALVQGQELETVEDVPLFGAAGRDVVQVAEVVPSGSLWLIVQASFAQEPFVQVCEGRARVTTISAGGHQQSSVLASETLTSGQRRSGVVTTTMIGDPRQSLPGWAIPAWALASPDLDVPFAPVSWRAHFGRAGNGAIADLLPGELVDGPNISGTVWRVPYKHCSAAVSHVHGQLQTADVGPLALTPRATIALRVYVEQPVRTLTIWFYQLNADGTSRRLFVQRANVPTQEWCSLMFDASELRETPSSMLAARADLRTPVRIDRIDVTSNSCAADPGCYIANIAIYERRD